MEEFLKQQLQKARRTRPPSIDANPIILLWSVYPPASYVLCYSLVVPTRTSTSPSSTPAKHKAPCPRSNLRPTPSCCEFGQSTMKQMKSLQLEQLSDHIF